MDPSLWAFLLSSPEHPVPFPWERCYDISSEILFYKNIVDETIVIDLRPRVNLGGGLFFNNSLWQELTGHFPINYHHPNRYPGYNQPEDQNPPIILYSNCCGQLVYLIVPEFVQNCPLCGCFMFFLG